MSRPKILNVNEGIDEALFYPYNVLVNKCSGNCDTLDNPMSKICVPKIIKNVNMKVYNFLMRLNETLNVLWHESCKCVCRLNSSVCNSKQIRNSNTCRYDCNEDFAGIINCNKGYTHRIQVLANVNAISGVNQVNLSIIKIAFVKIN